MSVASSLPRWTVIDGSELSRVRIYRLGPDTAGSPHCLWAGHGALSPGRGLDVVTVTTNRPRQRKRLSPTVLQWRRSALSCRVTLDNVHGGRAGHTFCLPERTSRLAGRRSPVAEAFQRA